MLGIKARGRRDVVTVGSHLPEVHADEWFEAQGHRMVKTEYGLPFQAEAPRTMPSTMVAGI